MRSETKSRIKITNQYYRDINFDTFDVSEIHTCEGTNGSQLGLDVYELELSRRIESGLATPRRVLIVEQSRDAAHYIHTTFRVSEDCCMVDDLNLVLK
jgi:hypothetical protein